jgi:hypothetical protein
MTKQEKLIQKALGTLEKYKWEIHIIGICGESPFEREVSFNIGVVAYDEEDAYKEVIKINMVANIKNKKFIYEKGSKVQ